MAHLDPTLQPEKQPDPAQLAGPQEIVENGQVPIGQNKSQISSLTHEKKIILLLMGLNGFPTKVVRDAFTQKNGRRKKCYMENENKNKKKKREIDSPW